MTSTGRLRIAVTVDPEIPVPPKLYGGIERIVDMLVRGLVEKGHEVTLFAHPDSSVLCKLEPYSGRRSQDHGDLLRNMWHVSSRIIWQGFDVVHSFARLAYLLPILPLRIPKLMSYQRSITPSPVLWAERLARGSLHFVGLSRHIIKPYMGKCNWHVVYNAAPMSRYLFSPNAVADAPLMFLGRLEEIKGPHLAVEVALRTGRRLIIGGNVPDGAKHKAFFDEKVAPFLDGHKIKYVGPVSDEQKNELLGQAAALLMPVLWEEPFGIVMAEALACGTPVIGLKRGSIPEVVQHGVTGFVCDSIDGMVNSVARIREIDRKACRMVMEEKFSDRVMVDAYEDLYVSMLSAKGSVAPCRRN